jgi:ADP-ribose pyrophosphatase
MRPWTTLARQTIFTQPPYIVLEQHTVQLPDGRIIPDWMWIITP